MRVSRLLFSFARVPRRSAARMNDKENPSVALREGGLASEEFRYRTALRCGSLFNESLLYEF